VLVGHRVADDGSNRLLLQNWWKDKPFVEVDAHYLNSCRAVIHAVETPQPTLGHYPTNSYPHVEAEFLDAGENFAPET
jgi:hypothetical protein